LFFRACSGQGSELDIIGSGIALINEKVRLIHIRTHSTEIDTGFRKIFSDYGWKNRWDYPRQREDVTPFGKLRFGDGVQSWENPEFG